MADTDDIHLPSWQPDHATSTCSICGTPFTFLNRRHHCRRCGRLVCATCSPHRITIPRQYIVRPPEERLWDEDATFTRPRSGTDASYVDNLGGGETVRVCNPCVPDPNYGPPPQHETPLPVPPPPPSSRSRASTYAHDTRPPASAEARDVSRIGPSTGSDDPSQGVSRPATYRHSYSGPTGPQGRFQPGIQTSRALQNMPQTQRMRASTSSQRTQSDDAVPSARPRYRTPSNAAVIGGFNPTTMMPNPLSARRPASRDTAALNEDDECPVCGTQEPPFGPGGAAPDRERHVEECLSNHFAFSAGPSNRPAPGPGVELSESPATPSIVGTPPTPSPAIRQRMLVYHATEKDCFDENGDPQECVICFEEFQAGDEMGRLECLCRFHRTCIRGWWAAKGPGSCPTHQLHG